MRLKDLIRRFRALANDRIEPFLSGRDDVVDWLNDAQAQACVRARLLVAEGDPLVCQIRLTVGQSAYTLHRSLYEIINLRIVTATGLVHRLTLQSREWLDVEMPYWREDTNSPRFAVQTDTGLRLVGGVTTGDVLHLEAYRTPLKMLSSDEDKPEIHEAHHEYLVQWALHRAFSVPDADAFDPVRAGLAEQAFTAHFGISPDADMRRKTRGDVQHHVQGYMQ